MVRVESIVDPPSTLSADDASAGMFGNSSRVVIPQRITAMRSVFVSVVAARMIVIIDGTARPRDDSNRGSGRDTSRSRVR